MCAAVRFPPPSRSLGYFHTSLGGKLSSRNCAPSLRIFDPSAWVLTSAIWSELNVCQESSGESSQGGFPRPKEKWCEAEVHRATGKSHSSRSRQIQKKAEAYFNRALAVARQQQAKSRELLAPVSMARIRRNQGERKEAWRYPAHRPLYYSTQ
jgi:hypothetical protein